MLHIQVFGPFIADQITKMTIEIQFFSLQT